MKRKAEDVADGEWEAPKWRNHDMEHEYRRRLANVKNAEEAAGIWQEASEHISLNEIHLTTALKACHSDAKVATRIMRQARLAGIQPNIFHFTCLLRIPGTPTKKILARMEKDGINGNHWSWNAALTGCSPEEVWEIFRKVPRPDRYAVASLLKKCQPDEVPCALKAAKKHGVVCDRAILNAAATASPGKFSELLDQIAVKPDLSFFNIVLNKAADLKTADVAREAFVELKKHGLRPDSFSLNRMLFALLRQGAWEDAKNVLENHRSLVDKHTWTIYGRFLVEADRVSEALGVYSAERPNLDRLKPDVAFFNVYLGACAKNANVEMAENIRSDLARFTTSDQITHHCMMQTFAVAGQLDAAEEELQRMEAAGIQATARTYNSLIDAATRAADFRRAKRLLRAMQENNLEADIFTFNILINGAANMGQCKKAERYFASMQELGIAPDAVTACTLLNAYSHSGEVEKAIRFHQQLPSLGLEPTTSSMNALVDCLSRSGQFECAWEQVQEAESAGLADTVTYMAFLGSCRNLKSKLHAKEAFQKLKEVADKPALASAYVLMSELHERLGQGEKARKLEAQRLSLGLVKQRGESYLQLPGGGSRTFVVGRMDAAEQDMIDHFNSRLRAGGHMPDLTAASARHDGDAAKEQSLCGHSEKKAVAVGLSTLSCGPISVTKNLRVCNDCHAAMVVASRVFEREIHLRDRSRWHIFKDGTCSCSGCW
mmetsp:Transcript_50486/g.141306  ORF Transcript_50486/g.141306 Transcript_50486/m.141306 type:complete len:718 (-) Transcript_50486:109-2262(-)